MQRHPNHDEDFGDREDRGGYSQQQGMGQRGRYEQNYGGYDDGRYGGAPQPSHHDRGAPGYEDRGGGDEQRRNEQRGSDEGRFGGSGRDAYDHGRHPSYSRGGYDPMHYGQEHGGRGFGHDSRGGYQQDATYDRNGYRVSNRGGYEDQASYGNSDRDRYGHGRDGHPEGDDRDRYQGRRGPFDRF
ncbi:MAG: hypothetical protein H0T46_24600 [Deltaproteobacteria bacterium]|nr:hypothetical protein [Deltaproteobacteria bacterium]